MFASPWTACKPLFMIAALTALLCSRSGFAAEPKAPPPHKPSQKWALLIGVNDYAYINKLKYCGADMEALRGRLIEAGFPENHVYLLSDKAKDSKYQPNKTNIETQIDLVTKLVGKDDVLVLAFAGHGVHLSDVDYICPVDAKLDESKSSLVSLDTVYERVRKSPAALKIMLVDACRDDPTPGGKRSAADTAEENRKFAKRLENIPQGIVLLNSCSPGESSMEDAKLSHGVFTYFLLEGLAGKADANGDGVVTLSELAEYVGDQTKNHVASQWAYLQRPYLKGDLSLDALRFDIGRVTLKSLTNSIGMKLALIPAGEFLMGSPESEPQRADDEEQHRVRITKSFYMGAYNVTKGEFARFATEEKYKTQAEKGEEGNGGWGYDPKTDKSEWKPTYNWLNPGFTQGDNHPVVVVTWNDANAFCEWLSRKEGKTYRLPTEAEWEYACRAGTTTPFHLGKSLNGGQENFRGDVPYNTTVKGPFLKHTTPVGIYKPNAFGLYDMHGNVRAWCSDLYSKDYYGRSPVDDPHGPPTGDLTVIRGGGFCLTPPEGRSATRTRCGGAYREHALGIRVVMQQ